MRKLHIAYCLVVASTLSFTVGSQLHQFGTKAEFTSEIQSASISIKLSVPDKEVASEKKKPSLEKELAPNEPKKGKPLPQSSIEKPKKESAPPPEPEPKKEPEVVEEIIPEKKVVEEPTAEKPEIDEPATEPPEPEDKNPDEDEIISKDE